MCHHFVLSAPASSSPSATATFSTSHYRLYTASFKKPRQSTAQSNRIICYLAVAHASLVLQCILDWSVQTSICAGEYPVSIFPHPACLRENRLLSESSTPSLAIPCKGPRLSALGTSNRVLSTRMCVPCYPNGSSVPSRGVWQWRASTYYPGSVVLTRMCSASTPLLCSACTPTQPPPGAPAL